MTNYVSCAGFISTLMGKLADIDTDLPLPEQHVSYFKSRLPDDGGYTFLKLLDGTNIEYIKVTNNKGALLVVRGLEYTSPNTFPLGTCVRWELTPTAIRDIVCQMPCCPEI